MEQRQAALPTLTLMFGSVEKKHWTLNRDVATVGRARGCDIALDAPDISSLHCLIWRTAGGWQVRDCGSRAGLQLNGDRLEEASLHDDDVLQIGPFSFRVSLPPAREVAARERQLKHLEQSRRHLARLALVLRHRLQEQQQLLLDNSGSAQHDLNRKASRLRRRFKDFEQRIRQLDQAERDLSRDRELFEKEKTKMPAVDPSLWHQQQQALQEAGQALCQQRAEMAALIKQLHDTLHGPSTSEVQALIEDNDRLRRLLDERERQPPASVTPPEVLEEIEALRSELNRLHNLLQAKDTLLEESRREEQPYRETVDLESYEAELNRYRQQLEADRQKLNAEMQQLRVRNQELDEATREMEMEFSRERAELARERTRLERLREDVRSELDRLHRDAPIRESLTSVQRLREGFTQHK